MKNIIRLLLPFFTLVFVACVKDNIEIKPSETGSREITLILPGMAAPSSYAIDIYNEHQINDVNVLVFEYDGTNETFLYSIQVDPIMEVRELLANGASKLLTISLNPTAPGQEIRIVVLANVQSLIPPLTVGATKESILNDMIFPVVGNKWNTNSGLDFAFIPMFGQSAILELDPDKNLDPIWMTRALAKIDVGLNYVNDVPTGLDDFKLDKVHVFNINDKGYVVNTTAAPHIPASAGRVLGPQVYTATGDREVTRQIYVAEALAFDDNFPAQALCLVLEGEYKGVKTFYRMDILKLATGGGSHEGLPIRRNYRYKINVQSCSREGYSTLMDAFNSLAANNYLYYSVDAVDESVTSTDGQYYLHSSQDQFYVELENATTGNTFTSSTNAPSWKVTAQNSWIHITSAATGIGTAPFTVTFNTDASGVGNQREGGILIEAGAIKKIIKVSQAYYIEVPANYGTYKNGRLEVYLFDQPAAARWIDYANVSEVEMSYNQPPFPKHMQLSPPHPKSCAALRAGGHSDWRLPSPEEMLAMQQYSIDKNGEELFLYSQFYKFYGIVSNYPFPYTLNYFLYVVAGNFNRHSPQILYSTSSNNYDNPYLWNYYNTGYQDVIRNYWIYSNDYAVTWNVGANPNGISYYSFITSKTRVLDNTLMGIRSSGVRCVRGDDVMNLTYKLSDTDSGLGYDLYLAQYDLSALTHRTDNSNSHQAHEDSYYAYANQVEGDFNGIQPQPNPARKNSCEALNSWNYGGFNNWRLPTYDEMYAILDYLETTEDYVGLGFPKLFDPLIQNYGVETRYYTSTPGTTGPHSKGLEVVTVSNVRVFRDVNLAKTLTSSNPSTAVRCVRD